MSKPLLLFVNLIRTEIAGYFETKQILTFWILTPPLRDIFLLHLSQTATFVFCPQTSQNVQSHWGKSTSSLYREIPLSVMLTLHFTSLCWVNDQKPLLCYNHIAHFPLCYQKVIFWHVDQMLSIFAPLSGSQPLTPTRLLKSLHPMLPIPEK